MAEKRKIEYKTVTRKGKEVTLYRYEGDDNWAVSENPQPVEGGSSA